ncbi:hypothetical protein NAT51_11225 [Flavobacterium amniphilum]|uniref:hypothetical protein n=1 Tax=Flavobacterium amniphilum TaxID=1834035 RepID=UPI00202A9B76|nr:hypothetical protein [Flavobacterium amniphilum]MCL9806099.1 hypothetical protein [Flavobacterium amniphilum]
MKKTNVSLEDYKGSLLNTGHLKNIKGGTVPPPGDPGDIKDPDLYNPRFNPPPSGNRNYTDPNPDSTGTNP